MSRRERYRMIQQLMTHRADAPEVAMMEQLFPIAAELASRHGLSLNSDSDRFVVTVRAAE